MYRRFFSRVGPLLPVFVLALVLCACAGGGEAASAPDGGEDRWQAGYGAGWSDGYAAGLAEGSRERSPAEDAPPAPEPPGPEDPALDSSGFVSLSQAVPDVILEPRYYSTYNFVGERLPGYDSPDLLLTEQAAQALQAVSADLAEQGFRLKVYDAYRPQPAVDRFRSWAADPSDTRMKEYFYPDLDKSVLFSRGYIAGKSGHSRGSTVDLTLFDMAAGADADMGGTFDLFGPVSHSGCVAGLTQEQLDRRRLLRQTMEAHGFRGISSEWWHFTLEDEPFPDTYFAFPVSALSAGVP